jgi:hypothetical protein
VSGAAPLFKPQARRPLFLYRQLLLEVRFPQLLAMRLGVRHIGFQAPLFL